MNVNSGQFLSIYLDKIDNKNCEKFTCLFWKNLIRLFLRRTKQNSKPLIIDFRGEKS